MGQLLLASIVGGIAYGAVLGLIDLWLWESAPAASDYEVFGWICFGTAVAVAIATYLTLSQLGRGRNSWRSRLLFAAGTVAAYCLTAALTLVARNVFWDGGDPPRNLLAVVPLLAIWIGTQLLALVMVSRAEDKWPSALTDEGSGGRSDENGLVSFSDAEYLHGFTNRGVLIGLNPYDRGLPLPVSKEDSVMVLGPPGRGKTTGIVVPTVRIWRGPVVATSVKWDVLKQSVSARQALGANVWLYDPSGQYEPPAGVKRLQWTPLSTADTYDGAVNVAEAMTKITDNSGRVNDTHFSERAAELLAPLLFAARHQNRSIVEVLQTLRSTTSDDADPLGPAMEWLKENGHDTPLSAVRSVLRTPHREFGSIISTASRCLRSYGTDAAAKTASSSNFSADEFVASDLDTIYVVSSSQNQERDAALIVGLITDIEQAAYRQAMAVEQGITAAKNNRLLFLLDETRNIAPMPDLGRLLSQGRGQGIQTMVCFQSLAQIDDRWGQSQGRAFFDACQTKVVFRGISNSQTLEELSVLSGEYERIYLSENEGFDRQRNRSEGESWSAKTERRISPSDVAGIPEGYVMAVIGAQPYLLWRHMPDLIPPPGVVDVRGRQDVTAQ